MSTIMLSNIVMAAINQGARSRVKRADRVSLAWSAGEFDWPICSGVGATASDLADLGPEPCCSVVSVAIVCSDGIMPVQQVPWPYKGASTLTGILLRCSARESPTSGRSIANVDLVGSQSV